MPDYTLRTFADTAPATQPTNSDTDRINFRTSVLNLERPGDPSVFDDATRAEAANLISRYPVGQARSALLPMLHLVQSVQGYVTPDGIAFCSDTLGLTKAQVAAVATFYTMYKRSPTGEYLVSVCTNTLCGLLGGDEIYAVLQDRLGVGHNQTTPDGSITLEHAECLAACDYAPVVTVNYEFFDNQSVDSTVALVDGLRAGQRPMPTRGAPLCTFRQIERQIAGFHDDAALAPEIAGSGTPTEAGVVLAQQRGDTAPSYAVQDAGSTNGSANGSTNGSASASPDEAPAETSAETSAGSSASRSRRRTGRTAPGRTSGPKPGASAGSGPSDSDAPLQTAESDAAHPTQTETEKG